MLCVGTSHAPIDYADIQSIGLRDHSAAYDGHCQLDPAPRISTLADVMQPVQEQQTEQHINFMTSIPHPSDQTADPKTQLELKNASGEQSKNLDIPACLDFQQAALNSHVLDDITAASQPPMQSEQENLHHESSVLAGVNDLENSAALEKVENSKSSEQETEHSESQQISDSEQYSGLGDTQVLGDESGVVDGVEMADDFKASAESAHKQNLGWKDRQGSDPSNGEPAMQNTNHAQGSFAPVPADSLGVGQKEDENTDADMDGSTATDEDNADIHSALNSDDGENLHSDDDEDSSHGNQSDAAQRQNDDRDTTEASSEEENTPHRDMREAEGSDSRLNGYREMSVSPKQEEIQPRQKRRAATVAMRNVKNFLASEGADAVSFDVSSLLLPYQS